MKLSRTNKILMTVGSLGVAATIGGIGTFAEFTDTQSATQQVSAGTVDIELNDSDSTYASAVVANVAPGDSVARYWKFTNPGSLPVREVKLTSVDVAVDAGKSGKLFNATADANSLRLQIESCDVAWQNGTCANPTTVVADSKAVSSTPRDVTGFALASGAVKHLKVTYKVPTTAANEAQGDAGTLTFQFDATQRTGTNS